MSEMPEGVACQICWLLAFEPAGFWDEGRPVMRYTTLRQLKKAVTPHTFAITMKANLSARRAPDGQRPTLTEEP